MGLFTPDLAFDVVTKDMIVKFKVSGFQVQMVFYGGNSIPFLFAAIFEQMIRLLIIDLCFFQRNIDRPS